MLTVLEDAPVKRVTVYRLPDTAPHRCRQPSRSARGRFGAGPYGAPRGPRLALQQWRGVPAGNGNARRRADQVEYERGRKEGVPSNVGPKPTFTGHAMQDALLDDGDTGQVRVYSVVFEPGARTYWHSHAAGQTLLVASGRGMVRDQGRRPAGRRGRRRGSGRRPARCTGTARRPTPSSATPPSPSASPAGQRKWARSTTEAPSKASDGRCQRPRAPAAGRGRYSRSGTGSRVTSRAESYLNFHLYGEPDAALDIDYFFWVIRDAGGAVTLVDTGFAPGGRRPAPPRPLDHARRGRCPGSASRRMTSRPW